MPIKTELGQLIDCTEEKFREFCNDKDVGYLSSFHNLMVQTYNDVQHIKEDMVFKFNSSEFDMTPENKSTLEGLYSKMLRIEQRVFILKDLIKSRTIK